MLFRSLIKLGGNLIYKERFMDHHRFTKQEILDFISGGVNADAEIIVTTEKDAVRFPELKKIDIPIYYLRVEIDILSGEETFNECISRMCFL